MRISLPATRLAVLSLVALTGCRDHMIGEFDFTLTADHAAGTASVDCRASTSGSCHFAFAGESPSNLTIGVGERATVTGLGPSARYCAASHTVNASSCKLQALPPRRVHVSTRSSTDSDPESGE